MEDWHYRVDLVHTTQPELELNSDGTAYVPTGDSVNLKRRGEILIEGSYVTPGGQEYYNPFMFGFWLSNQEVRSMIRRRWVRMFPSEPLQWGISDRVGHHRLSRRAMQNRQENLHKLRRLFEDPNIPELQTFRQQASQEYDDRVTQIQNYILGPKGGKVFMMPDDDDGDNLIGARR